MNHTPIPTDLFDRAATALFPIVTDDNSPAILGPARDAEGGLNPQAWSQILSLLSWFGYDSIPLYAEVLDSALEDDPSFPRETLFMRTFDAELLAVAKVAQNSERIGEAVEAVDFMWTAIETMAVVLNGYGEPVEAQALLRMRGMLKDLDEQINTRIEREKV